jgi:hypothetical protein
LGGLSDTDRYSQAVSPIPNPERIGDAYREAIGDSCAERISVSYVEARAPIADSKAVADRHPGQHLHGASCQPGIGPRQLQPE